MKNQVYEIYGAKVEIINRTPAMVTYKVIATGTIQKLGVKKWNENAKKVEVK